jgi:(1->4)-alpha-D-glucan 1-alpha-D-glucosylmutase
MPDRNDEYMFYQAMAGSFPCDEAELPLFRERLRAYAVKAVREAKVHTAWLKPDTEYEAAFHSFIDALLSPGEDNRFLKGFREFQRKVSHYGVYNSLAQTIVKITAPGVPDFYQGSELWGFSFVDPDNRRLVDFELRECLMEEICAREGDLPGLARELRDSHHDGRAKLFLIRRAL